jgi:hypothetical protein
MGEKAICPSLKNESTAVSHYKDRRSDGGELLVFFLLNVNFWRKLAMKKIYPIAGLVTAAAIIVGGYYLKTNVNLPSDGNSTAQEALPFPGHSTDESAKSTASSLSSPNDDLQAYQKEVNAKLAMLAAEVTALRQQLRDQAMKDQPQASAENETSRNARNDPVAQAEEQRKYKELIAAKETAFQQEPLDGQWAPQTSSSLREAMSKNPAMRDAVRNIECRSSTCRVEITDTEQVRSSKSLDNIITQVGDSLPQVTYNQIDEGNGESAMVMYMSRVAEQSPDK